MTFKPRIWTPIAGVLAAVNVVAVYFAAQAAEPMHAAIHAALGLAFTVWTVRLRARAVNALRDGATGQSDLVLGEMDDVRHELAEVQERLDFAERMLAQRHEQERVPRTELP